MSSSKSGRDQNSTWSFNLISLRTSADGVSSTVEMVFKLTEIIASAG
jgi:hypothetical protein